MKPLPLISKPLTAQQLRQRVSSNWPLTTGTGTGRLRKETAEMTPAARAEVQRILDAEARQILATRLEGDAVAPAAGTTTCIEDGLG